MNSFLADAKDVVLAHIGGEYRPRLAALFAFDSELSAAVTRASEPIVAQLRLAWWRDEIGKPEQARTLSVPLLAELTDIYGSEISKLGELVDGFEALALNDAESGLKGVYGVQKGRTTALNAVIGAENASGLAQPLRDVAASWTFAQYAGGEAHPALKQVAADLLTRKPPAFPRELRGLTILDRLARRSIARGGGPLLATRGDATTALRLGLFGR